MSLEGSLVISSLIDAQIMVYAQVAMLALLTYDYILSLGQEVAYIWASNWGSVKVLYFFSRYSPFIDTILAIEEKLNHRVDSASCNRTMTFNTVFTSLGIGISDLILIVRTYAMYQRSRTVLIILLVLWVAVLAVGVVAASRWSTSDTVAFSESITLSGGSSCFLIGENKAGVVSYISLLLAETVLVMFTVWNGFRESQSYPQHGFFGATQSVLITFYRDAITLGNVLVTAYAPLIIHVREVANLPDDQTRDLSALFFGTNNSSSETPEV
ncbi:hypothetical protein BDP27DRAFT_1411696 [Rhodocollybia butyracea]|uniref:DUF6533 domain-containing protein n=1 Tax=Rhodocollybia butyracea TaxID=206335 RepID=A0A9P5P4B4_9AGAR|nr:hypothetical protein BDP27DRAFT_1411696 [Rhodocollybia butyracea]